MNLHQPDIDIMNILPAPMVIPDEIAHSTPKNRSIDIQNRLRRSVMDHFIRCSGIEKFTESCCSEIERIAYIELERVLQVALEVKQKKILGTHDISMALELLGVNVPEFF